MPTDDASVLDRLNLALDTEALPAAARDHATHLIRRLSSPVRVVCLGREGSGKSQLINMLAGARIIPDAVTLPTLELCYGDADKMIVTRADGAVAESDAIDLCDLSTAAFVRIETPSPILKRISLLEVSADGDPAEQRAAVDWAIRRTDIAIWCTQAFSQGERDLWSRVPDSLKDHAFLVLTKADELTQADALTQRIAELEEVVAEEFHSLFAVATRHALSALADATTRDEAMFEASGGAALTSEILAHADRGRRADLDSAYLFLSRYQVRSDPHQARDTARRRSKPSPAVEPAPQPVPQPVAAVAAVETAQAPAPAAPEAPKAEAPAPLSVAAATPSKSITVFSDAVRFLRRQSSGLSETAANLGPGETRPIIDQCVDTVEHLVDLFAQDETDDPVADDFIDELAEAAEIMVLMQLEDGDAPAADAVTLLLQLRRDMESKLVA